MRRLAAVVLIVVLVGCGRSKVDRVKEEDRVRIAVFEYQMQRYQAAVFFISVGEAAGDPDAVIMKHFEGRVPPVKPASQGLPGGGGSINDMTTGEQGIILKAGAINWISEKEAEVTGGYFANTKSATGNTYHMLLRKGEWVVDKDTIDWEV